MRQQERKNGLLRSARNDGSAQPEIRIWKSPFSIPSPCVPH
jgi:hypothetical protein